MLKVFSIIIVSGVVSVGMAHSHKVHSHRGHGAHQHGAVSMGLAFEGTSGRVQLKFPSESLFGFEREAKSEKDKKTVAEALTKLEGQIGEMLFFDPTLTCRLTKEKIEVKRESKKSNHSDTLADFRVDCARSPKGSNLIFRFHSAFPRIKSIEVQALVDDVQKSIKVEKNDVSLSLSQ